MALRKWKLQDAKNHFSDVVECAITDGPQEIIKNEEQSVVILSLALYKKLSKPKDNLVDFFKNSPLYGSELDLKRMRSSSYYR